ncbi:hypothetical protein P280DRAFT_503055 [Massarina eburnea CBS 473.64]|uniref:Rhodopsin domain-containing protein n=1 Tax=Massarina eburnea CBS 473.64 TaxID=1395130 RepID=A0A6A6SF62_9PLEO|nr:hypothetical protein P280DRAFT_503055 [Massarina eburnea CBS 473.64]
MAMNYLLHRAVEHRTRPEEKMESSESQPSSTSAISPSQVVVVVGWFMVAFFVAATCARLGTKLSMKRMLGIDDGLIIISTVLGIGQMMATFVQALLAKPELTTGSKWDTFQKAFFASQLLFIPTICTAKLSILHSLHQLTPVREHKAITSGVAIVVIASLVAFELATGLQCTQAHWKILSGKCFNQTLFWQTFSVVDITTDLFIALFPTYIVCNLQMGTRIKVVIASIFATRISTIITSSARLIYVSRSHASTQLSSYPFWISILITEIEQGLSIITACIPFLKPFFEALDTGMLAPSRGLLVSVKSSIGSRDRSKRSQNSEGVSELNERSGSAMGMTGGIHVSRRISTHSERWEWDKDGERAWAQTVAEARSNV